MSPRLEIASRLLAARTINSRAIGDALMNANVLIKADRIFGLIENNTPLCEADQKIAEAVGLVDLISGRSKIDPEGDLTSTAVCQRCGKRSTWGGHRDFTHLTGCPVCKFTTEHKFTPDPSWAPRRFDFTNGGFTMFARQPATS